MTPESPLSHNVRPYHTELTSFLSSSTDPSTLGKGLRVGIISESLTSPGTNPRRRPYSPRRREETLHPRRRYRRRSLGPNAPPRPAIWTASTRTHMASLTAASRVPDLLSHSLPHWNPRWPMDQEMFDLLTHANPALINIILGETFLSKKFPSSSQAKAHRHVLQLREAYNIALENYDVLITPTCPTVAPPHPDLRAEKDGGSTVMEKMLIAVGSTNNTCPFNVSGHPAMSVPCGWERALGGSGIKGTRVKGEEGWLPVGMQIIGRRWDEISVLRAGKVFEAGGGGLGKWPGLV